MHKNATAQKAKNFEMSCSIVGARGYAGLETAKLLLKHPKAKLTHCFATSDFKLSHYLPSEFASQVVCLRDSEVMNHLTDVVFLATPAEVSLELVPKILAQGKKVIDLSGAFRLKKNSYKEWYGFEHNQAEALLEAQYGLVPWVGPLVTNLISNPGCYATAIAMALIPLVSSSLIDEKTIVVDAKSGTTGGGKKATENLLFSEVDGECLPYKVGRHQHYPEIVEAIEAFGKKEISAHMTTSLLPVRRGIIAGIYAQLLEGVEIRDVVKAFATSYASYPLVTHGNLKDEPSLLSLKKVVGTSRTHISYEVVGRKLYVFSCIDNLLKGAASQAIENLNRILDLPVTTSIDQMEATT